MSEKSEKPVITMYDPPSGWRYGFPKQYLPREGETIATTLLRDGYPPSMIDRATRVRFWEEQKEQS